jgi:hypothetical protein
MDAESLFIQLIEGLYHSGLMLLGKAKHPENDKLYKDLKEADRTINILMMLEVKTKNNLSDFEKQRLREIVTSLQMLYIEETKLKD